MTSYVVLVPGIMGTRLSLPDGEEVWPPTVQETQLGYGRKDKLAREDLVVGDIIRKVWCVSFYDSLIAQLEDIGFKESASGQQRLKIFTYDWRRDLEQTSNLLATELSKLVADGATSIVVVAHSMGGLIARLALEQPKNANTAWLAKVSSLHTLGTPHLGAPLALARVMGLDSAMGISAADFRELSNDVRYPSAYQLLPAPGEAACWDIVAPTLPALDIYDKPTAARLGLNQALLKRALFVHKALAPMRRPKHIRYFCFAGAGHDTVTRVNLGPGGAQVTTTDDGGDGTVPLWSALPLAVQKQLVSGEHASFFSKGPFSAVFYRLFGKSSGTSPVALALASAVTLSVKLPIIPADEEIDLLLVPEEPAGTIKGTLLLERTEKPETPFVVVGKPIAVTYDGPVTTQLKLILPAVNLPGQYRLSFSGKPGNSKPVHFAAHARH